MTDFLTDGYIAYTFTPRAAEAYLRNLFKVDPAQAMPFFHQGAFLVWNHPMNYNLPPRNINGHPAWLLDYPVKRGGSVVPQQIWTPAGQGDSRRYVEQAPLSVPLFFFNADGSLGVPVANAATGQMLLHGANGPVPLGDRTTIKIRIGWPGYMPPEQQVQLKDQTSARNPVTLERFVKHVASRVRHFLVDCERVPIHNPALNWKWGLRRDNITVDEVLLIGLVQVSAGSWMPILQLMGRVVI